MRLRKRTLLSRHRLAPPFIRALSSSELKPCAAGGLGEGLHAALVAETTTVKADGGDVLLEAFLVHVLSCPFSAPSIWRISSLCCRCKVLQVMSVMPLPMVSSTTLTCMCCFALKTASLGLAQVPSIF